MMESNPEQSPSNELQSIIRKIMHDVNNPLCVINLSLSRLENLMETQPHPELTKSYEEISSSADKLLEILAGLEKARMLLE